MKVKIGKYINWIGPYQIVDAIFFWIKKPNWFNEVDEKLQQRWDYRLHERAGKWLADTWVADACQWIHYRRHRTIKVQIDKYDTWSMDNTLSHIVVPMLKQLRATKHGSPAVDPKDVPKELRPTARQRKKYNEQGETDDLFHRRWEWVMDEMIWAHEQLLNENGEEQFWLEHGELDWNGEPDENGMTELKWTKESKVDWDGLKAYHARIDNGLRLWGKYYRALWD